MPRTAPPPLPTPDDLDHEGQSHQDQQRKLRMGQSHASLHGCGVTTHPVQAPVRVSSGPASSFVPERSGVS
jgi:hypothetical protein